jgi:hypothetical protein
LDLDNKFKLLREFNDALDESAAERQHIKRIKKRHSRYAQDKVTKLFTEGGCPAPLSEILGELEYNRDGITDPVIRSAKELVYTKEDGKVLDFNKPVIFLHAKDNLHDPQLASLHAFSIQNAAKALQVGTRVAELCSKNNRAYAVTDWKPDKAMELYRDALVSLPSPCPHGKPP